MHLGRMSLPERVIRGSIGLGLLALYALASPRPAWALLGVIPLVTALFGFCPLYALARRRVAADGPADSRGPGTADPVARTTTARVAAGEPRGEEPPGSHEPSSEDGPPAVGHGPAPRDGAARDGTRSRNRAKRGRKKARGRGRRGAGAAPRTSTRKPAPEVQEGRVVHATDATFDALVRGTPQPVLVDFWAEWCGPCKAIAPALDELAAEMAGEARIVKVNVDSCPRTAGQFNIRSIPTLVLLDAGEVADVLVGVQSKAKLAKLLARAAR